MKNSKPINSVPTRLLNTPLMVHEDEINKILGVLNNRLSFFDELEDRETEQSASVAVIPISGGLIYRGYGWYWRTSYRKIRESFTAAMDDPSIRAVVFDIDSPGGEIAGVFDLVDRIYSARGQKPIYAVANENAFSAAYAIGSAADTFYLSRTARLGSIGVISVHVDESKFDEKMGLTYTAIYAGARKNDFSSHQPLSASARDTAQLWVDRSYDLFVNAVARNRGLQPGDIRRTEAAIFQGQEAVDAGLADAVLSWEEAMDTILSKINVSKGGTFMKLDELKTGLKDF